MSYANLVARMQGAVDNLPPSLVNNLINDALEGLYRSYDWGFLYKRDYMRSPAMIDSGTASVTKYLNTITLNSTASALVNALTVNEIPIVERQFRTFATKFTGRAFNYQITAFDSSNPAAIILTIDPPYLDETNASIRFQILKLFYNPPPCIINNTPIIDFRFFKYVISKRINRQLRLDLSWEEINRADPSRFSFGEPFCMFSSPDSVDTNEYIPVFEMYPAPKFERIYEVIYLRNGRKFADDGSDDATELPSPFTEELVLNRARVKAYEFAIAKAQDLKLTNIGRFQNLIVLADRQKDDLLDAAKKIDRELFPRGWISQYMDTPFMDSSIGMGSLGEAEFAPMSTIGASNLIINF